MIISSIETIAPDINEICTPIMGNHKIEIIKNTSSKQHVQDPLYTGMLTRSRLKRLVNKENDLRRREIKRKQTAEMNRNNEEDDDEEQEEEHVQENEEKQLDEQLEAQHIQNQ